MRGGKYVKKERLWFKIHRKPCEPTEVFLLTENGVCCITCLSMLLFFRLMPNLRLTKVYGIRKHAELFTLNLIYHESISDE
ncbi:hypothetical protein HMPREF9446_00216 [Bacteroides fluxus YIT 12057]|uniref:Uncharacterized protein n=1 Tax=Bacteroides fluxus YIT 12057 TaxID=763034 RepID=F3PND0_9BACE|nr:hypothetical protein HMPREF9446_00216 [Bacteroides fluxus YIT 12057]